MIKIKTPNQDVFDTVFRLAQQTGLEVYDHRPIKDEKVTYPFIDIGDTQQTQIVNKSYIGGHIIQTVHVWGLSKQRKQVSDICEAVMKSARNTKHTDFYCVQMQFDQSDLQIIQDDSTNTLFWHGIVQINFKLI